MKYILVKWKRNDLEDPVLLYSELNDDRWETRKVEVYSDGRMGYADRERRSGDTSIGLEPVPTCSGPR